MGDNQRRRSLHVRLAGWMVVSTLITVAVFSSVLYVTLRLEEVDQAPSSGHSEEPLGAEASEQMLVATLFAAPIALLVAVGGAVLLSRRALRPLAEVIAAARRVTTSNLQQRLPLPARQDELYELTAEMNGLLERLDQGFSALARYAADASHELRTPLAVIVSKLEVAARHPRSVLEWEGAVSGALAELRRLAQLVEALLALARADAPAQPAVELDLREQIDLVLSNYEERAKASGIALSRATEGDLQPTPVLGDLDAIGIALRNVIDNAIRYTPRGGRVRVSLHVSSVQLEVLVEDSGPGVALQERESIFLPLRRGSAAAAEGSIGHGLGLAIVRRVMQSHGGTVHVEAGSDGGASFVLCFPRSHPASGGF
jgi:two-component system heavy metal sensor histidine kinase CusS